MKMCNGTFLNCVQIIYMNCSKWVCPDFSRYSSLHFPYIWAYFMKPALNNFGNNGF